jgi:hypothetical protein
MNHALGMIVIAGFIWLFLGCFFCFLVVEEYHDPSPAVVVYVLFTALVAAVLAVFGVFGP